MHIGFAELDDQEVERIASLMDFYLDEKNEEDRQAKEIEARSHAR